jgi:hypothetical protein
MTEKSRGVRGKVPIVRKPSPSKKTGGKVPVVPKDPGTSKSKKAK